ncbi:hypothetical protein C7974DRAFT_123608 [Boeremia exigua]|uniref:uncharacterized protein n=1 Tax=Boeremia exigua TaxID=749465 RepID=UPI001E8DDE74|nr:uncharacterized protein C7974DRAFT_123608 [Boeremia exigua]KAH6638928.1 hypothetical protein C7974DRAFT_123608 [Boeremia exigua]
MPPAIQLQHHNYHRRARDYIPQGVAATPSTKLLLRANVSLSLALSPSPPREPTHTTPSVSQNPTSKSTILNRPRAAPPISHTHTFTTDIHAHTMQRSTAPTPLIHNSPAEDTEALSLYMWLGLLVFIVVTVAGCWSIAVCAVHYRGATTGMEKQTARRDGEREQERGRKGGWWAWVRGARAGGKGYEALRTGELEESAAGLQLGPCGEATGREEVNPFLVPVGRPLRSVRVRSSEEWADEHRAFFTGARRLGKLGDDGPCSTAAERKNVALEMLEAQGERLPHDYETAQDGVDRQESRSWVDLGLAVVDDAVDRVAAKLVRWTEDGGRDEELVLPLAKGKLD